MATKFTAKRGVHFADLGIDFVYDEDLSRNRSADAETGTDRVFSCELDAAKTKALKALDKDVSAEYGIAEVSSSKDDEKD